MRFDDLNVGFADGAALLQHMFAGQTLGPLLGQSLESQEALYSMAYALYGQGKYDEAMKLFVLLLLCDHLDRRHHSGIAACMQVQRRHRDAIKYWRVASMLDLTDPEPVVRTAECHMHLGERSAAHRALTYALVQAKAHEPHRHHVPRIEALLQLLDTDAGTNAPAAPQDASAVSAQQT